MSIYYAVVGIAMYGLNAALGANVDPATASATMIMAMWVVALIDVKIVSPKISIIRSALPGFSWIDLAFYLAICVVMARAAFVARSAAEDALLQAIAWSAVGIVGLMIFTAIRWRGWRRPPTPSK